jgi:hypothetical protein
MGEVGERRALAREKTLSEVMWPSRAVRRANAPNDGAIHFESATQGRLSKEANDADSTNTNELPRMYLLKAAHESAR